MTAETALFAALQRPEPRHAAAGARQQQLRHGQGPHGITMALQGAEAAPVAPEAHRAV